MKEKSESKEKIVYEKAIQEAISKGILSDYLTRKGDAVVEMLMNQFSGDFAEDSEEPEDKDEDKDEDKNN